MIMKRTLPLFLGATTVAAIGFTAWVNQGTPAYEARQANDPAASAKGMQEYMTMIRKNSLTGEIEAGDYIKAYAAARQFAASQAKAIGFQWDNMGPNNVGGRTRTICIHPDAPNTVWAGGVSGGLWKSEDAANTWQRVSGLSESLIISSIAVTNSGKIYVATGNSAEGAGGTGGSGFIGHGIYRSSDGGASFELVTGPPTNWNGGADWAITNKIIADPNDANKLWVATNNGPRIYDEAANTFSTVPGITSSSFCQSLEVVKDESGDVGIILRTGTQNWVSVDGGNNFEQIAANDGLPTSGIGRVEFAISPQDVNYMYALIATGGGAMRGGFYSTDGGQVWDQIWPSGTDAPALDIFGDNSQGNYDIVVTVNPQNKEEIFVGGVSLWKTALNAQPEQVAIAQDFPGCFVCVHADVHELTWSPDGTTLYVGCDGGVYKSFGSGANFAWLASNKDYNVTQFYSGTHDPKGRVMGGTQDNGTQYISLATANDPRRAIEVSGGDGFDCEISQLDPNIMMASIYAGAVFRSNNAGGVFGDFYDDRILALGEPGDITGNGLGDFYTNMRLFEDANDLNSPDSGLFAVEWIVEDNDFTVGDTLGDPFPQIFSKKMPAVPLPATTWSLDGFPDGTTANTVYEVGDTVNYLIQLPDRVESLFAVGFSGTDGIWVTRDATSFAGNVEWWKVAANASGNVNVLEWSANGDILFWGTSEGDVYKVQGFDQAYDSAAADVTSATRVLSQPIQVYNGSAAITGLCADPNDNNRLLITLGEYGGTSKVRLSTDAYQPAPTTINVWNNIPADLAGMPVYDGIIHSSSADLFVVGTEFGVMVSEDGGDNWAFENTGMELVPTFQVRQQTWNWQTHPMGADFVENPGVVYLATHGRGFFKSETLLGVVPPAAGQGTTNAASNLQVFPNPASDVATVAFEVRATSQVTATVYDLNGRVVRTLPQQRMAPGKQRLNINVDDLRNGTYVVDVRINGSSRTGRLVVNR